MADTKKYLHNLNVANNKVMNLLLNPLTTVQRAAIGSGLGIGDQSYVCYDTDLDQQYFWDGTQWIVVGGGGGGTNPTTLYIPYNNAGTFADSYLINDTANSILKSNYSSADIGLKLDFAGGQYWIGDATSIDYQAFAIFNGGTVSGSSEIQLVSRDLILAQELTININGTNGIAKTVYNAVDKGIYLDFVGNEYYLGDTNYFVKVNTSVPNTAISTLSGTGTEMVVADASGILSRQAIPTGTITSIATTSPITGGTITTTGTIGISQATTSTDGYLSSTDWTTFNGKFNLPSLTAGSVLFSNGTTIAQDNANFFWDDTNNRLGIGTATPSYKLDVQGIYGSGTGVALNVVGNISVTNGGYGTNTISAVKNYFASQNNNFYGNITFDPAWVQGNVIKIDCNAPNNDAQPWIPLSFQHSVARASLTQPNYLIDINPTYNFTGTYSGITRGIYYHPVLTSLNGATHIAYENISGDIIHGNLSGVGTRMVTADVNGQLSTQTIPSGGGGTVTSVGLSMPSAFTVASSPVTGSGTIAVTGAGTTAQYIKGDGSLGTTVTKTSELTNDGDNGYTHFISVEDLPSNLVLYATNVASGISTYTKAVSSLTDPDYNTVAVDIPIGPLTSTTVATPCGGIISSANIIIGNPGIFTMSTLGSIRRTSGTAEGVFFYEVYKRTSGGTETLIMTSDNTSPVSSSVYVEFNASGLFNNGVFTATDRVVVKFYGKRLSGGSDPSFDFQFGGLNPVRTTLPIPLTVTPLPREILSVSTATAALSIYGIDYIYLVSGTTTITLPTAVGSVSKYTIKNSGTGVVSIATTSSQTIDGSASPITINLQYVSLDLISNGTNWEII